MWRLAKRFEERSKAEGAEDLGNMFQFYAKFEPMLHASRDVALSKSLNPELQSFDQRLARNASRIPIE